MTDMKFSSSKSTEMFRGDNSTTSPDQSNCLNLQILIAELVQIEVERALKRAIPTAASCDHNRHHPHHDPDESQTPLSQASEMHRPRETYSHEKAYHHTPETSRYTSSDNSQGTSSRVRISFHQTSILREAYAQLLSQILSSTLAQHGSSTLTDELFQVLTSLLSTRELECHVEQHAGRTRIQFLSENRRAPLHSEINLHQNFRSS